MISTGTLSLVNAPSGRDPEVEVQARSVNTRFPSNCTANFQNEQESERSSRAALTSNRDASRHQHDSNEASHLSIHPTHSTTDFNSSSYQPGPSSSRSSSSLASSFNTVMHLSSSTIIEPTPTSQVAQGSFLESGSDSSQLLAELATKSANEDASDSHPNGTLSADLEDAKGAKIQFHNVVRISGGITSSPKRKRASKQVPRKIRAERRRSPSIDSGSSKTSRSPADRSSFRNGSPSCPHRVNSPNPISTHDSRSARPEEIRRFDNRDPSSSPVSQSFQANRQSTLRPGPPSTRSSFSRQSRSRNDSASSSAAKNQHGPPSLPLSFPRTSSISSSFTGSGNYSATIISRSSSPASSLYLPLRIPISRAPAPFFGPTPERVARVRERRQVAQRDAERAKGGWKAWWNNWYYQSDRLATRKGKSKQGSTSGAPDDDHEDHTHCHPHSLEDGDSDDGSCYHDVILDHERKKLERKLKKVEQIRHSIGRKSDRPESSTHQRKRKRPNPEQAGSKAPQSWLSWASSIIVGLPPSPTHPLLLPTPGSGILRRPTLTTTSLLPAKPVLPLVSNPTHLCSDSDPRPGSYLGVPEVDSRTPLLGRPPMISSYGNLPPEPSPADPFQCSSQIKTSTDARFGLAPRRWFSVYWWFWKVQTLCLTCYLHCKSRLVGLFHVDWDSDEGRYEGWENV